MHAQSLPGETPNARPGSAVLSPCLFGSFMDLLDGTIVIFADPRSSPIWAPPTRGLVSVDAFGLGWRSIFWINVPSASSRSRSACGSCPSPDHARPARST